MPWNSDRFIWAALCFTIGFAYSYIPVILHEIRELTVVPDPADNGPNKQLQKDAEKALSLRTLKTLSDGSSHEIRAATIKIVASRSIHSRVKKLLLADLGGNEEQRGNAIRGLELLITNPAFFERDNAAHFLDFASFHAIVTALQNLLSQHPLPWSGPVSASPPLPPSPVCPAARPAHEKKLMRFLYELLALPPANFVHPDKESSITRALEAGLVTRWLKHYPFPCSLQENGRFNFKRSDVASLFAVKVWFSDDPLMADIFHILMSTAEGAKQLREAGLANSNAEISPTSPDWLQVISADIGTDVRMVNGESTAGATTPPELRELLDSVDRTRPTQRSAGTSQEEDSRRRRHREAIVIAEAGVPLRRENILQRQDSRTTGRTNDEATIHELLEEFTASADEQHGSSTQPINSRTLDRQMARLEAISQRFEAEGIMTELDFSGRADDVPEIAALLPEDANRLRQEEAQGEAMVNALLRATEERRTAVERRVGRGQASTQHEDPHR